MKRSAIGWTDYSGGDLNFVTGCTPVSAGCRECYARRIYNRFGRDFSTVTVHPDKLERLRTAKFPRENNKRGPHVRPMCFVCDTGDIFHESVPAEFIAAAFETMRAREDVDWQVLTKRPLRMIDVLFGQGGAETPHFLGTGDYYSNIWMGVTVENQESVWRVAELVQAWVGTTFVSVEPMLEPVKLFNADGDIARMRSTMCFSPDRLNWVVVGAESGPNRRPFDVAWAADLKAQCDDADVAYFGKQASGARPGVPLVIDGRVWHDWPEGS